MLRISKKADYAVYLLGAIARQGAFPGGEAADSVVSAHEAARQVGLNKSVVANLLKDCARFGLLDSVRGLRGGYRLARRPSDVSLGQILEAVEGPFSLVDCCASASGAEQPAANTELLPQAQSMREHTTDCSLLSSCPSKQPMRVVHERIVRLFDEIRLDELCSMTPVSSHALTGAGERPGN